MPEQNAEIICPAKGITVRHAIDNMGWADLGGATLVIDALEKPEEWNAVDNAIKETTPDQPVKWLVNTHLHPDHTALNSRFEKEYGAAIVNSQTRKIEADGLRLSGTRRHCEIYCAPPCHTRNDWVVWLPADKVLFVGDLFCWGLIPYIGRMNDKAQKQLSGVYQMLRKFPADTVVPGHGPVCSSSELARFDEYSQRLFKDIKNALQNDVSPHKVKEDFAEPPADMLNWWRFTDWKHAANVDNIIRAFAV